MDAVLRELYLERGLNLEQVGVELGISKGAVSRWLERFGIEARRSGRAY
jgi:transcriptional regulator with XRE-family HTH domain